MASGLNPRDMLAKLVAFPTVSTRSNLDLIGFVEAYLADLGVRSLRVPDATGEKAGLVVLVGPAVPGGVVLSGHTDVVPVAGQAWTSDPFTLVQRGDRLHGRGACDMKGFAACALALVPEMLAAPLSRPILIALTRDEEIGCIGAPPLIEAMLAEMPRPEAVIVGEPSEMRVVTGQKGSWGFRARVRGHEVHSSLMHTGVSAVMTAAGLIDWMARLMAEEAAARAAQRLRPALDHRPRRHDRRRHRQQHHRPRLHLLRRGALPARRGPRRLARAASSPRPPAARPGSAASTPTPPSSSRPGCSCPASSPTRRPRPWRGR